MTWGECNKLKMLVQCIKFAQTSLAEFGHFCDIISVGMQNYMLVPLTGMAVGIKLLTDRRNAIHDAVLVTVSLFHLHNKSFTIGS